MPQFLFSKWPKYQNGYCIYGLKTAYKVFIITPTLEDGNILCSQIYELILDLFQCSSFLIYSCAESKNNILSVFLSKCFWIRDSKTLTILFEVIKYEIGPSKVRND